MYLCVCNAVSETRITEAIRSGCCSFDDIVSVTGVCTECGQCAFTARKECERLLGEHGHGNYLQTNLGQLPAPVITYSPRIPHTKSECV